MTEAKSDALAQSTPDSLWAQTRDLLANARVHIIPRTPSDETLLVEAMLLVASADGKLDPSERILFETYSKVIRDFRGRDFTALLRSARSNIEAAGPWQSAVRRLVHLSNRELRKKCFVLAVDFAFVSGNISRAEAEVVGAMAEVLELDPHFVRMAIEIATCRHGGPKALPE